MGKARRTPMLSGQGFSDQLFAYDREQLIAFMTSGLGGSARVAVKKLDLRAISQYSGTGGGNNVQ